MSKEIKDCPEFPFFGARYPDARCVDGKLYDLDKCDGNGNLYEPGDDWPCPFCQTEAFIKQFAEANNIKYSHARKEVKAFKEKYLTKQQ
jgi:hypothetical protein